MMTKPDDASSDAMEANGHADEHVGDVESAGETTAADTISGPTDTSPVGAQTMVKVNDSRQPAQDEPD